MDIENDLINDMEEARTIYSYRPGVNDSTLPPKGGLKFSSANNRPEEIERMAMYHAAQYKAIASLKVRKIENIGTANWLPELCVAKILKQGKFMQRVGRKHPKGFLALFAEEALFLLDIGDLELLYLGVPLSLQDAFLMLLSPLPGGMLCTLEEYQVYSYLSKSNKFRVQRVDCNFYNSCLDSPCMSPNNVQITDKESSSKRKRMSEESDADDNNVSTVKRKATINNKKKGKLKKELTVTKRSSQKPVFCENNSKSSQDRGWWLTQGHLENTCSIPTKHKHIPFKGVKPYFPDFTGNHREMILSIQDQTLIPQNTSCFVSTVPKIWWERIKKGEKHETSENSLNYTHTKTVCRENIARVSKNWDQYCSLLSQARANIVMEAKEYHFSMINQKVQPLLKLGDCTCSDCYENKLKLSDECNSVSSCSSHKLNIRFNVFQLNNKPFRKTCPGEPYCKIIVSDSHSVLPSLAEILQIKKDSNGKLVKIAVVHFGKIVFYSLDVVSVPLAVTKN